MAVDKETGAFEIVDTLFITDVGQIINPIGHQGQIDGGFIYGLGGATMEEMPEDESGKITTLSLGEYKLPTINDLPPPFRTIHVPAEGQGPYGAKMAGELSNSGRGARVDERNPRRGRCAAGRVSDYVGTHLQRTAARKRQCLTSRYRAPMATRFRRTS